jgi:hypothetical protein
MDTTKKRAQGMENSENMTLICGFEGGAVYTCERDGRFLLIVDESATFDLLDEDDREGIEPVKELTFPDAESREAYIQQRGWRNTP